MQWDWRPLTLHQDEVLTHSHTLTHGPNFGICRSEFTVTSSPWLKVPVSAPPEWMIHFYRSPTDNICLCRTARSHCLESLQGQLGKIMRPINSDSLKRSSHRIRKSVKLLKKQLIRNTYFSSLVTKADVWIQFKGQKCTSKVVLLSSFIKSKRKGESLCVSFMIICKICGSNFTKN